MTDKNSNIPKKLYVIHNIGSFKNKAHAHYQKEITRYEHIREDHKTLIDNVASSLFGNDPPAPMDKTLASEYRFPQFVYYIESLLQAKQPIESTIIKEQSECRDDEFVDNMVKSALINTTCAYIERKYTDKTEFSKKPPSRHTNQDKKVIVKNDESIIKLFEEKIYDMLTAAEDAVVDNEVEEIFQTREYRNTEYTPEFNDTMARVAQEMRSETTKDWSLTKRAQFIEYLRSYQPNHHNKVEFYKDEYVASKKIETLKELISVAEMAYWGEFVKQAAR